MIHTEVSEKEFNDRLQFFNMELIVVSKVPYLCEFFVGGDVYVGEIRDEGDRKFYLTKSFIEEENEVFRKFLLNNSQKSIDS